MGLGLGVGDKFGAPMARDPLMAGRCPVVVWAKKAVALCRLTPVA